MFKKLTEQYTRDNTRTLYVNMDRVDKIASIANGTRLWFGVAMTDVIETVDQIISVPEQLVLTDTKDVVDGGSRNEDGRVSNPA